MEATRGPFDVTMAADAPGARPRRGTVSDAQPIDPRTIEDATCLGCACLCDDIGLVVEGGRIVEARAACASGRAWYEWVQSDLAVGPMIAGRPATPDRTLDRAAEVLAGARAPVVLGLGTTVEAHRAAVAIADRIGAAIEPLFDGPADLATFQRLGTVSATLGEIRDRADLVIFDAPDWPENLPRFFERFVDPPGRFVAGGRAGRTIVVLRGPDEGEPSDGALDAKPDLIVETPARRSPTYSILRALVDGVAFDPGEFEAMTGTPLDRLVDLAGRLKRAGYGVLIHGRSRYASADAPAALALVRDLNRFTRFVALSPTVSASRSGGAALAWQAGAAGAVDFALGHPRHLPREGVVGRLHRREVDAALLVGDVCYPSELLIEAYEAALGAIPKVFIGPIMPEEREGGGPTLRLRRSLLESDAFLPTARPGIDEGGTVARFDGVMLPLRPPFSGRRPSQADALRAIDARLAASQTRRDPAR